MRREKITIQLNNILYTTVLSVKESVKDIAEKLVMSTLDMNFDTYTLIIICDYEMSVEVIRRIHAICNSPSDFVEIILK